MNPPHAIEAPGDDGAVGSRHRDRSAYTFGFSRLYLKTGEEVRIRFTPVRSGKFTFTCDIHPGMEGEVFALRVGRA
jgi:plastocyanin